MKALVNRTTNGDVDFKHTRFGRRGAILGELDRKDSGSASIYKGLAGSQEP